MANVVRIRIFLVSGTSGQPASEKTNALWLAVDLALERRMLDMKKNIDDYSVRSEKRQAIAIRCNFKP